MSYNTNINKQPSALKGKCQLMGKVSQKSDFCYFGGRSIWGHELLEDAEWYSRVFCHKACTNYPIFQHFCLGDKRYFGKSCFYNLWEAWERRAESSDTGNPYLLCLIVAWPRGQCWEEDIKDVYKSLQEGGKGKTRSPEYLWKVSATPRVS